jgi:hypothetical protein
VRKGLANLIAPASQDDYDAVAVTHGDESARLTQIDAVEVVVNLLEDVVTDSERVMEDVRLEVVQPAFDEQYVWRFDDGRHRFTARIEDESFLARVISEQESFRAGDSIVADVRVRSRHQRGGRELRTYTITRVAPRTAPELQARTVRYLTEEVEELPPAPRQLGAGSDSDEDSESSDGE